jgi:phosphoglycolate phosphatase-like HAD superfamily hydrolase
VKLVLFDIDGTILVAGGAGRRAIHRALLEVFGNIGPSDHRFDGKTDPQIVRELMRHVGHADDHIDARMRELLDRYVVCLGEELRAAPAGMVVFPGVRALLDELDERADIVLGLLTGNLDDGARAKLAAAGIDPERFVVGAFGSDSERRDQLPAIAQQRTRERLGVDIAGRDVIVIGDTPADVTCARTIGARAIAVATGQYTIDELASYAPAAVFDDLSDTAAVLGVILHDGVPA